MGNDDTEQYYLERRLFGDDYVEGIFREHEGEGREGRVRSLRECCEERNREIQGGGLQKDDVSYLPPIRHKGRGDTERPTCPNCGEDMKVSLEHVRGKSPKRYGIHCKKCKIEIFD